MPKTLPDIIYDRSKVTPIIDARSSNYIVPFYKTGEYFDSLESYNNFIKGTERLVRQNDRYRKYISYLKTEVHLNRCQVLKNVDDQDADIEMHHGPVYTLYDICAIVIEYFLVKKWKITSMRIADQVLMEHQKNRIQVVMLSSTIHEEVHAKNIFINMNQAYGDLNAFLKKYGPTMPNEYKEKLNHYIDLSMVNDSTDHNILNLNKLLFQ
jgi:hypothetical protein